MQHLIWKYFVQNFDFYINKKINSPHSLPPIQKKKSQKQELILINFFDLKIFFFQVQSE